MIGIRTRFATLAVSAAVAITGLTSTAVAQAAPTVPACGNDSLTVTRSFVQSGAGHSWALLIYRNHTNRSCSVYGYPGVDAIGAGDQVLAHARRAPVGYGGQGKLSTVTIAPYHFASASVEWVNFNPRTSGPCATAAHIDTIVANTTRVHRLSIPVTACGLAVHPTVANTPQYPHYGRAQHRWIVGASVDAAHMDYYILRAAKALRRIGQYPTQIAQLEQLASLPLTDLTPTQIKQARADVAALDQFFATPGLYS